MLEVIPAIDIKDGCCVRLVQGRASESTQYSKNPVDVALRWFALGAKRLHIVDLNGAFDGVPANRDCIADIIQAVPQMQVQVGGGIRSTATANDYLELGAQWIILGTRAVQDVDFVGGLCADHPGRIIAGLDARDGIVAVAGWTRTGEATAEDAAKRLVAAGVQTLVHTDISRDGMLSGVNVRASVSLARESGARIIASGGVGSSDDIIALRDCGEPLITGVIAGKSLYEGRLDLAEALELCQ